MGAQQQRQLGEVGGRGRSLAQAKKNETTFKGLSKLLPLCFLVIWLCAFQLLLQAFC